MRSYYPDKGPAPTLVDGKVPQPDRNPRPVDVPPNPDYHHPDRPGRGAGTRDILEQTYQRYKQAGYHRPQHEAQPAELRYHRNLDRYHPETQRLVPQLRSNYQESPSSPAPWRRIWNADVTYRQKNTPQAADPSLAQRRPPKANPTAAQFIPSSDEVRAEIPDNAKEVKIKVKR